MSPSTKTLSVALLIADTPVPSVLESRGDYFKIYKELLDSSLADIRRHDWQDKIDIHLRPYDVVTKMEYPDEGQLFDGLWDAVIITGSASSAYADLPWINKLAGWVRNLADNHPLVRIIGICFGHQIVSRAFDAKVEPNEKGWELGTTECELTEDGRLYLGYSDDDKEMRIQQVHKDHVPVLPAPYNGNSFVNLATTSNSPIQGLALRYPTDAPPLPSSAGTSAYMAFDISDSGTSSSGPSAQRNLHVLCLQGHPEFDEDIVKKVVDVREEKGILSKEFAKECRANAEKGHDGRKLGKAILATLGVEPARTEEGLQM